MADIYKLNTEKKKPVPSPKTWTSRHPNEDIYDVSQFDTMHEDEWNEDSIGRLTEDSWDKKYAKKYFDDNNLKGEMFVKDLSTDFDTEGLLDTYDLVITNDFLEHVLNPSIIAQKIFKLTHDQSRWLVSNPNWRMGHQYVYRGLFDFDNIIYFLKIHGFIMDGGKVWQSPLKTPPAPRLDSESMLPDSLLDSWNHYILLERKQTYNNDNFNNRTNS